MPDHAAVPCDEGPAAEPAHPKPAATARTVAAGVLLAAFALAFGAIVVSCVAGLRLAFSGDDALSLDGAGLVLLALAFAGTTCVVIVAGSRSWAAPRARTLVLAGSLAIITALSGVPLIAAAVSILAIGAALAHDRLVPGRRSVWGPVSFAALAAGALAAAVAGAAITDTHPNPRTADEVSLGATWNPDTLLNDRAAATDENAARGRGEKAASAAKLRHDAAVAAGAHADATAGAKDKTATGAGGTDKAAANGRDDDAAHADGGKTSAATATAGGSAAAPSASTHGVPTPGPGGVAPGLEDAGESPAAPSHAATPSAPAAAAVPAQSAEQFVRAYYADLNAGRFDAAWSVLSPGVRAQLGPFARWKGGYGRTLSSEPQDIVVGGAGGDVAVTHVLVARDSGCASERSFRVTWRLRANSGGWNVTGLSAVALGSPHC